MLVGTIVEDQENPAIVKDQENRGAFDAKGTV